MEDGFPSSDEFYSLARMEPSSPSSLMENIHDVLSMWGRVSFAINIIPDPTHTTVICMVVYYHAYSAVAFIQYNITMHTVWLHLPCIHITKSYYTII